MPKSATILTTVFFALTALGMAGVSCDEDSDWRDDSDGPDGPDGGGDGDTDCALNAGYPCACDSDPCGDPEVESCLPINDNDDDDIGYCTRSCETDADCEADWGTGGACALQLSYKGTTIMVCIVGCDPDVGGCPPDLECLPAPGNPQASACQ
ncbi:MAG: hypothetical protein GY854_22425 [Deltaproteobacteria bacterium]|nr:hypothetical protein [Deltaproteobacteria bacterium]